MRVEHDLPTVTAVSLAFSVYIDVVGTSEPVLLNLIMNDGSTTHDFEIVERVPPGVAYIEDVNTPNGGTSSYAFFQMQQLTTSAWHRVELHYQSGAAASLQVVFDGTTVLDTAPMYTTAGAGSVQLGVAFLAAPALPWRIHFDDFALQLP